MSPLAGAVAAGLALAFLPGAALPAGAAGRIVFESERCDLGALVQGERPLCEFALSNAGDGELEILEVEPACGCTTALPPPSRLPPGGRSALALSFDSSAFAGDVEKTVAVRSSDPGRPEVTLTIAAHVEAEIEFEPRQVTFARAAPGIPARETVVFVNRRAEPVAVRAVAARPGSFACRLPAWEEPTRPYPVEPWDRVVLEVEVTPPPDFAMPLVGECALEISGPRRERFTLLLIARPSR